MVARKLFVGCLALVLLTRAVHCLCVDVSLCAHAASNQSESPLSDPKDTDPNESGCLCKGALLGGHCLPTDLQSHAKLVLPSQLALAPTFLALQVPSEPSSQDFLWPPPRSGNLLRALIASWQI